MSWLPVQTVAQISVERILNALPEGLLIAVFAWGLLRVLRRQNSGTRFAVWFLALLTVAVLPLLGPFSRGQALTTSGIGSVHPAITVPAGWALAAFLLWGLGVCVAMLRLATGFWRLRGLRRSCTPIDAANLDPAVQNAVQNVQKTLDAIGAGSITIATSDRVSVPAAIGFGERTIIFPAWTLRELPPEDINVILLHEFAHLRRGDDWTNLIQKIVRALFFFHPAVWWIENRLSVEREMACDDAVLAATANPHAYATCLVSLLEKSRAHRLSARLSDESRPDEHQSDKKLSLAQAAVHRAREASLRLAQILDTNRPVATRVWKPALGIIGTFSLVCLSVLPHAPEFVAVDRGTAMAHPVLTAALSQSSLPSALPTPPTAMVIPAALRTGERIPVRATAHHAVPDRIAAQQNASANAPPPERVVEVSASAEQGTEPHVRTIVFVEATQYVTSDSSGRVQMWQVTFVRTVREQLARVPVAKST